MGANSSKSAQQQCHEGPNMIPGTISRHTTNDTAGISKPRGHVFCFVLPEERTPKKEREKKEPQIPKKVKKKNRSERGEFCAN